jgi:transcription initiation factor TFIID subunit 8
VAQTAVAALCLETGATSVEKRALDSMCQLLESYILQVGRRARDYSEVAARTAPTYSDVELALVDVGTDPASLSEYAKRPQRRHLPKQTHGHAPQQRRVLAVGTRRQRPLHVSPHLPPFPDPHTYIRTPTFSAPVSEYRVVRERLGRQQRNSRRGLSKLVGKTRPSHPVTGEVDKYGLYTVVTCQPPSGPLYLQALVPTPAEAADTVAAEKLASSGDKTPSPSDPRSKLPATAATGRPDGGPGSQGEEKGLNDSQELYENPFLKPPKRIRLRLLN